jgi:hypothetical protein
MTHDRGMARWICPACDRQFGRAHQSHTCVPGNTVRDCFAAKPGQLAIYLEIARHLRSIGPIHEDAVRVGVFVKRVRTLAEVRPKSRWLSLELVLPRSRSSPRVARTIRTSADRVVHVIRLAAVDEVDDELREWLTEAYVAAG